MYPVFTDTFQAFEYRSHLIISWRDCGQLEFHKIADVQSYLTSFPACPLPPFSHKRRLSKFWLGQDGSANESRFLHGSDVITAHQLYGFTFCDHNAFIT